MTLTRTEIDNEARGFDPRQKRWPRHLGNAVGHCAQRLRRHRLYFLAGAR
jgi:hypothetical protein